LFKRLHPGTIVLLSGVVIVGSTVAAAAAPANRGGQRHHGGSVVTSVNGVSTAGTCGVAGAAGNFTIVGKHLHIVTRRRGYVHNLHGQLRPGAVVRGRLRGQLRKGPRDLLLGNLDDDLCRRASPEHRPHPGSGHLRQRRPHRRHMWRFGHDG